MDGNILADLDEREVAFEDLQLNPDPGEIGNGEERLSDVDVLPLPDSFSVTTPEKWK